MDVRASNGKELYLMFRRNEIKNLFKIKENRLEDFYKYAEIAMDLHAYDFAATLFSITGIIYEEKAEKSLFNFLYCLDKLGVNEIKTFFKIDYDKVFKEIELEKEKEMKNNSLYKSMKN